MDDLLREFLTETSDSLDAVGVELVRFEQEPNNAQILQHIFRLVHTIKGTCGFLSLPRLEALAHAAESLMGKFRDGMPVSGEAVTLILASIDRLKEILATLEATQEEPSGSDADLIRELDRMALGPHATARPAETSGSLVYQVLERPLRPGEASLDDLERAFRETDVDPMTFVAPSQAPASEKAQGQGAASAAPAQGRTSEEGRRGTQSIRVGLDTLEQLVTMVSELVLTRNQLVEIMRRENAAAFKAPVQRLSTVTAELQQGIMKTRMQPIGTAWQKFPRMLRELAAELGKEIELQMRGAETELDRQVLDLIKDPLTHMVRNAADHGLETHAERRALGKTAKGCIQLAARHAGGQVVVEIADDGRGLDTGRIKAKAIAAGLISEAAARSLSVPQLHQLIFEPGLSTAREVTSVSGRGVGMDVVKTNIDQIGGTIEVKSTPGAGSVFTIKIPLTLAILPALIVAVDGDRYAIPQLSIVELVRIKPDSEHRIEHIRDAPVLRLRDKLLPLARLGTLFATSSDGAHEGFVIVMQAGSRNFGVVVEDVLDTEEIVVKPVATKLRHVTMFSGTTILGDGSVIMILDPVGIEAAVGGVDETPQDRERGETRVTTEADRQVSLLLFRAGSPQRKAVPVALVSRIEEIDCAKVEVSNNRTFVQYRGSLMPLLGMHHGSGIPREGLRPALVFSHEGRAMGLLVDEILDIVTDRLCVDAASETPGLLGSAIIDGKATEIIDVGHFLPLAFEDWFCRKELSRRVAAPELLLVDDSPFFRSMLPPLLHSAGYRVTAVDSGDAAISELRTRQDFHAIVCDLEMPIMDGLELARALRGDPQTAHVPMIALSSSFVPGAAERALDAGFRDCVAKFDQPGLIAALMQSAMQCEQAA